MRPASRVFLLPVFVLAAVILSGCAGGKGQAPAGTAGAPQPKELWNAFIAGSGIVTSFTMDGSLSVQSPKKSAHLSAAFWGNVDRPLRLNLSTGMGQTFTMWREDANGWLAVYPLSKQAFTHTSTKAALAKLGMPFPFGLHELAALVTGRYGLLVPATSTSVKKTSQGYEYSLPTSSPIATVILDAKGRPVRFVSRGVEPWSVDLGDFPEEPGHEWTARKITLTTPGGLQAVLRVKKLELRKTPVDDEKPLELPLPPGMRATSLTRPGDVDMPPMP